MVDIPSTRLDKLTESLKEKAGRSVPEVVCDFEEAIRLATYSGCNDVATYLISTYREYFEKPIPYEVRFYCDFYTGIRLWRRGDLDEATAIYGSCRDLALRNKDQLSASRCVMAQGVIRWSTGDYSKALSLMEKAEEGLRGTRDITLSNCLNWLGVISGNLRLYSRAWGFYTEALELNEEKGFHGNQGYLLCNMGLLCQQMGLYDQAEESFRKSMALQKQVGNRYGYIDSMSNLGMLMHKHHKLYREALPILREAAEMQLENGEKAKAGLVYTNAAVASFHLGNTEEAMSLFDTAEELVFSTDIWDTQVEFCGMKAEVLVALKDYDGAEELFNKGSDLFSRNLPGKADKDLLRVQSELYEQKGDYKEAYVTLLASVNAGEEIERVKVAAMQSVVQVISNSATKNRELQEAKYRSSLLEEKNSALAISEERFRKLVQAMTGIGVMAFDREGRITFWNGTCENLYGYPAARVMNQRVSDILVSPVFQSRLRSSLGGECSGDEFEVALPAADGSMKDVQVSTVTLSPDETFLIQIDLTNQHRAENQKSLMEEQMRRAQKLEALGTLAGGIAHDFNNLLQGILGNASLLCNTLEEGSDELESAKLIKTAAERSSDLCVQMLDYAGVESVVHEFLDINQEIRELSTLLDTSFHSNVELVLDLDDDIPGIMGDRSQLRQVVMNLALNGAEAISASGKVIISTSRVHMEQEDFAGNLLEETPAGGDYLCITVRDQGKGIEPRDLTRIFDPFFSTKKTGRGLGLAAVLGIVRGHAGAITVSSSPGAGSEFNIYLKCSNGEFSEPHRESFNAEPSLLEGKTVLVVDDEQIVRETVSSILRTSGSLPVTFKGGAEVLRYLEQGSSADLIILDLTMPGMSGLDVFRILTEREIHIPVLIISGYSRDKLSTVFANRSPVGFLQKPFTPEVLTAKLNSIIQTH